MNASTDPDTIMTRAGEDLFNFAIEREDVKWLMEQFSASSKVKAVTLEYELQILKIISVGWSISYHLGGLPGRQTALGELFWGAVNNFSKDLSQTTGLMIGQDLDYFETLKERLNHYLQAVQDSSDAPDPAVTIGPVFAGLCGDQEDVFAAMAGSKMFANAVARVRQYLEAVKLC